MKSKTNESEKDSTEDSATLDTDIEPAYPAPGMQPEPFFSRLSRRLFPRTSGRSLNGSKSIPLDSVVQGDENMENLAHVELIELMLQTRIPLATLIDWIDQSILFLHPRFRS